MASPSDERRHHSADCDVFAFLFDEPSLGRGAFLLSFRSANPAGVVVAALARPEASYLYVHDVVDNVGRDVIGIRGSGVWADATCNAPLSTWTIGLEAFAVGVDSAHEAVADGPGDRVGLGFDLDFESVGEALSLNVASAGDGRIDAGQGNGAYRMSVTVHGDVLIGDDRSGVETTSIDCVGTFEHRWGSQEWCAALSSATEVVPSDSLALSIATPTDPSAPPADMPGDHKTSLLYRLWAPTPWYSLA